MASKETIIKNIPVGKEHAISLTNLEQKIGNINSGTNNDTTRSEIRKIIKNSEAPIGSCKKGVYIPANESELQELIDKNQKMAKSYEQKANNIKKAYEDMK